MGFRKRKTFFFSSSPLSSLFGPAAPSRGPAGQPAQPAFLAPLSPFPVVGLAAAQRGPATPHSPRRDLGTAVGNRPRPLVSHPSGFPPPQTPLSPPLPRSLNRCRRCSPPRGKPLPPPLSSTLPPPSPALAGALPVARSRPPAAFQRGPARPRRPGAAPLACGVPERPHPALGARRPRPPPAACPARRASPSRARAPRPAMARRGSGSSARGRGLAMAPRPGAPRRCPPTLSPSPARRGALPAWLARPWPGPVRRPWRLGPARLGVPRPCSARPRRAGPARP
jgi:hypothetical protein